MPHTTEIVETLQVADGIISVCICCCGLKGEWKPCPCGDTEKGCADCNKTALEPHPHGGQFPVIRLGFTKDPDTRSWNAFHLVVHDESGPRLRSNDELQAFIDANHKRIAALHEAAVNAVQHSTAQHGNTTEHP